MKKKRIINCGICGSPCTWYRKGKRHRLLICPNDGIIASNPLPLAPLLASAAGFIASKAGKKAVMGGVLTGGAALLTKKLFGGKKEQQDGTGEESEVRHIITDKAEVPNSGSTEWYINKALRD